MDENKVMETADTAKTIMEHTAIILNYRKTGLIDRDTAIKKYRDFNVSYPEYYARISIVGSISNSLANIGNMNDFEIVSNLNSQLIYIGGKNLLEGLLNG